MLLWRFFYDASPHGVFNTILGWVGLGPLPWLQDAATAMPSIVIEATWAAAGATVIIYLAALLGVRPELYDAAEVDGASIWQKIRLHHAAAAAQRPVRDADPAADRDGPAVHRAVAVHGRRPGQLDADGAAAHLRYAFQNSLGGDYGMAAALSLMLAAFLAVFTAGYYWLTRRWSTDS